ncbi:MAG: hypothetical protein M3410_18025 [Acidobacteriota bacterium]|nr:hypothetical protein [Acidobacteriota bacterium]
MESHVGCYEASALKRLRDATGLSGGVSRWLLQRKCALNDCEMPPACPVESHVGSLLAHPEIVSDGAG